MKIANTVLEAAEIAAEYIYHFLYHSGAEVEDCLNEASNIYTQITGEELNAREYFGFDEDDELEDGLFVGYVDEYPEEL